MAISKGREVTASSFKRYIGVAPCSVLVVNPTKKEMKDILGIDREDEPVYTGTREVNGKNVRTARITVWLQPNKDKLGFDVPPISVSYTILEAPRYSRDMTKVQVIDKYAANDKERGVVARTAWPTIEEAKNHATTMTGKNGLYQSSISCEYRPVYQGEEDLVNLIIAYLNIPSVTAYNEEKKEWYTVSNPEDSECRLDCVKDYFNGDVTEIKEAFALQPNNEVKVLFGVRTDDKGHQYQTAYTKMYLRANQNNYGKLDALVQFDRENGYLNGDFTVADLREFKPEATNFTDSNAAMPFEADPFAAPKTDVDPNNPFEIMQ